MSTVTTDLHALLGDRVVTDPSVAAGYGVDAYPPAAGLGGEDFTVVRARSREDVVTTLRYAAQHRVPVVPQGARTATTGAARAIGGGIVLSTKLMRTVEIDPVERIAVVGPGVVNTDLKAAAAEHGLAYPPDPASSAMCSIGGNVATNAGGLCCVKYGVTADYVRGLEVVLPGGDVVRTGRRTAKGVAGYDLTGLFVGSEGTLGVVTEAVLKLVPLGDPALTVLAVFPTLAATMAGVAALREQRHTPSLVELLDGPSVDAISAYGDYGFPTSTGGVPTSTLCHRCSRRGAVTSLTRTRKRKLRYWSSVSTLASKVPVVPPSPTWIGYERLSRTERRPSNSISAFSGILRPTLPLTTNSWPVAIRLGKSSSRVVS
ncbi:MAG: hypothetical protein DCC50_04275, partial [Acidobacteria bacterium]